MLIYDDNKTKIRFDEFENIKKIIQSQNSFLIIDRTVYEIYPELFKNANIIVINAIEHNKSIITYSGIINKLLSKNFERKTNIIGIGGGIICDLAGFVAATYKRGTNLILIPTTLLAQVDAAIGGKNGVNFCNIKNSVGTFYKPNEILICSKFLNSIPIDEKYNGFAEIIKIALIYDKEMSLLLDNYDDSDVNSNFLNHIISKSILNKMKIVSLDFEDNDLRNILNLGHTLGHSIEIEHNISHGKAVSLGISFIAYTSLKLNLISESEFNYIQNTLQKFNLPVSMNIDSFKLIKTIFNDKKVNNKQIREVFFDGLFKHTFRYLTKDEYKEFLDDWNKFR